MSAEFKERLQQNEIEATIVAQRVLEALTGISNEYSKKSPLSRYLYIAQELRAKIYNNNLTEPHKQVLEIFAQVYEGLEATKNLNQKATFNEYLQHAIANPRCLLITKIALQELIHAHIDY